MDHDESLRSIKLLVVRAILTTRLLKGGAAYYASTMNNLCEPQNKGKKMKGAGIGCGIKIALFGGDREDGRAFHSAAKA